MQQEILLSVLERQKQLSIAEAKGIRDSSLAAKNLQITGQITNRTLDIKEKEIVGNQSNTRRSIDAMLQMNTTNTIEETKREKMRLANDLEKLKVIKGAEVSINADNNRTDVQMRTREVVETAVTSLSDVAQAAQGRSSGGRRYKSKKQQSDS